ncbi:MAG: prolyl oligopeptidase family serine peptidase [Verrucomicrobiota bacterium]
MKTTLSLLLALVAIFLVMKAKAQTSNSPVTAATLDWKSTRKGELKYLLYLPQDYKKSDGEKWPLMLFLHGAGERGTDVNRVAIHGPMSLVKQGTNFPFIIVAPQCPAGELWDNEPLLQLLDRMTDKYSVDTNRIYLTGLSMGGYGTWKLGLAHPDKFAAIAPICGGASMIDVILGTWDKKKELEKLPVWAFHGAKDDVVPLIQSERVVNSLKRGGVKNIKLTVYPETKHDSWKEAYADPKFYEWLLTQSR